MNTTEKEINLNAKKLTNTDGNGPSAIVREINAVVIMFHTT
jgi:hypothetical protein